MNPYHKAENFQPKICHLYDSEWGDVAFWGPRLTGRRASLELSHVGCFWPFLGPEQLEISPRVILTAWDFLSPPKIPKRFLNWLKIQPFNHNY